MSKLETATFGAGCFWHVEDVFRKVPGVVDAAVGFMGGRVANPSYERVCAGDTGHAEVCQVTYDPSIVSYEQLLEKFWEIHDPTQVNRQGSDVGSQYRSVIFTHTPEQAAAASASKEALVRSRTYKKSIATAIEPAREFSRAEEYHQRYLEKHGGGTCVR